MDLRRFDQDARRIIRKALADGWTGYVSKRGHMILRHPNGVTTAAVSPNLSKKNGRARANTLRDLGLYHDR